jgi:hypothetical protein
MVSHPGLAVFKDETGVLKFRLNGAVLLRREPPPHGLLHFGAVPAQWQQAETQSTSLRSAVSDKLFAKEFRHARMEFAVERRSVEVCGLVGANARDRGCKLRRARRQENKVAGRHGMNF